MRYKGTQTGMSQQDLAQDRAFWRDLLVSRITANDGVAVRIVDHIVGVTGTQQVEEVEAALAARRAEPGEAVIADLLVWTAPDGI